MSALFIFLWTNFTNTELVIQTSAGSPTTRGASALADFNANKRMPMPDLRGRIVAGMDNPGSGAANRITNAQADINGGVMGTENHTLTTTEMPSHNHANSIGFMIKVASGGSHAITGGGSEVFIASATNNAGSGGSHNNTQPTFFANYFIYTGN
jgi:microcystin-dependent protein